MPVHPPRTLRRVESVERLLPRPARPNRARGDRSRQHETHSERCRPENSRARDHEKSSFASTTSRCEPIFTSSASRMNELIIELPPYDMNGSVRPVVGSSPSVTQVLIKTCEQKIVTQPTAISRPAGSRV